MLPTSQKRFSTKTILIWLAIGFAVLVVFMLGCLWYIAEAQLNARLAALRAKGMPATASEINAFYVVPEGVADTTHLWMEASDAAQAANLGTRGAALPIIGKGPTPIPAPGEDWAELEASRTLLSELDREFELVRKAVAAGGQVRYPCDFSDGINTLLPHVQDAHQPARLMQLDAHVSAHDGNNSRALDDIRAIFAVSDTLRTEPTLVSQLVRIAIHGMGCRTAMRLLPHCDWTDAELASLQKVIRSARFKDELAIGLCGERAMCLTALDEAPLGPLRYPNKQETLRIFESSFDGLDGSWADAISRQREISEQIKTIAGGRISRLVLSGVILLSPASEWSFISGARAEASQKCANIIVAAHRHRLKHGQLPEKLADIEQELLGPPSDHVANVIDPYTGKPLLYKIEAKRVVIYSVGKNEQDDGGDVDRSDQDWPLDVGFSLKK